MRKKQTPFTEESRQGFESHIKGLREQRIKDNATNQKDKKYRTLGIEQKQMEAERSGTPLTHIGHFYMAFKDVIDGILNRKKGKEKNIQRGVSNYKAIVKIAKENNIDLMAIKKAALVPTFKQYFNEVGKKHGKYNLNPLKEGQLYIYQCRFKSESKPK